MNNNGENPAESKQSSWEKPHETDYGKHEHNPRPPKPIARNERGTTSKRILAWAVPVAVITLILAWYLFFKKTA